MDPIELRQAGTLGASAARSGVLAAAAGSVLLAACSRTPASTARPEPGDRAAAQVGGQTIWVSDVRRQAATEGVIPAGAPLDPSSDLFRRALDEVIDEKLLAREAVRLRLDRDPAARRRLEAAREKLLGDLLVESVIDRAVNEASIRTLYEEQQRLSAKSEELRARQILLPSEADAQGVLKLLGAGADFGALALQRSADQATRFNGGDLGYFTLETMPAAYGVALRSAKPGEIVGPFRIDSGWVVMKVEDRRARAPLGLDQARPQIVRFLTYDEIRNLLTRLRQGTRIQVLAPAPSPVRAPGLPATPAPGAAISPAPSSRR